HIEHGEGDEGSGEPAVGRGVQLPEFADAGALPAAHLGAVELKGVEPEGLGSGEAVGAGRYATQSLAQEVQDRLRPGSGVVASRAAGRPVRALFLRAGAEVGGGQAVEPTAGEAELFRRLRGAQGALPEGVEHMADEGGGVATMELLILFKDPQNTCRPWLHHQSS